MDNICGTIPFYKFSILKCPCDGVKVDGMPTLMLRLKDNFMFSFNSTEYFIYPSHGNNVKQA